MFLVEKPKAFFPSFLSYSVRLVVKFGGTSLATGEKIRKAAESIKAEIDRGNEVAVVVSAMGDSTDRLIEVSDSAGVEEKHRDEIISMGERTSARVFNAVLSSLTDSISLEPGHKHWPVITDKEGSIDENRSQEKINQLKTLLGKKVPIICGFLGETTDGEITTLERGGSDTTATLLGKYLNADEVIIATDVEGIMTGDPESVEKPQSVESITTEEMKDLSERGAKVIAPSALRYKTEGTTIRVVHHENLEGGTIIEGSPRRQIELREEKLAAVTIAGKSILETPGLLSKVSTYLGKEGINIYGHSTGRDSMSFFLKQTEGKKAQELLHKEVAKKEKLTGVSLRENIAMLVIYNIEDLAGAMKETSQALKKADIDVVEISSSVTSIAIFIDWTDRHQALELVEEIPLP